MAGFELEMSGEGGDHSANLFATFTDQLLLFHEKLMNFAFLVKNQAVLVRFEPSRPILM